MSSQLESKHDISLCQEQKRVAYDDILEYSSQKQESEQQEINNDANEDKGKTISLQSNEREKILEIIA